MELMDSLIALISAVTSRLVWRRTMLRSQLRCLRGLMMFLLRMEGIVIRRRDWCFRRKIQLISELDPPRLTPSGMGAAWDGLEPDEKGEFKAGQKPKRRR